MSSRTPRSTIVVSRVSQIERQVVVDGVHAFTARKSSVGLWVIFALTSKTPIGCTRNAGEIEREIAAFIAGPFSSEKI